LRGVGIRTRFAPSPTGYLHVGNARTAIFNWLYTRHARGKLILRIEDTDQERSRPEYEAAILRELSWLGLDWDEGIEEGDHGPYRQSERHAKGLYRHALERLQATGDVYPCFCSMEQLGADREASLKAGKAPRYSGRCRTVPAEKARRRMESGEPAVLRFRIPEGSLRFDDVLRGPIEVDLGHVGDPVVFRSDGWPTYNFAVVVDDIGMEITDVIRGEDHISNTPRQLLLYRAMGAEPPRFAHLPLVLGPDHAPLSKRHGDTSLAQFADRGFPAEAVLNYLALLGWAPQGKEEVLSPGQLVEQFDLKKVGRSAGVFDRTKLEWLGNQHLRRTASDELVPRALPYFQSRGDFPPVAGSEHRTWLSHLLDLVKESVSHLAEVPDTDAARIVLHFDPDSCLKDPRARSDLKEPSCREVIRTFAKLLPGQKPLDRESYRNTAQETGRITGTKGRDLYHPIRLALTARTSGPELVRLVPLIEEAAGIQLPLGVPGCAQRAWKIAELMEGEA
jgi:nondiscriminating glutamyl-tRNA synthetase